MYWRYFKPIKAGTNFLFISIAKHLFIPVSRAKYQLYNKIETLRRGLILKVSGNIHVMMSMNFNSTHLVQ